MFGIFKINKVKKEVENIFLDEKNNYEKVNNFKIEKTSPIEKVNNFCFFAYSLDKKQSIYIKLSIDSKQTTVWFDFLDGSNKYYLDQQIYDTNCPLKITNDNEVYEISFAGYLKKNDKDLVRITLSCKFKSKEDNISYHNIINKKRLIKSLVLNKKNDEILEYIKNNKYNYYEQLGTLSGKIIVEGQHNLFEMPCLKKKSFGYINWEHTNNHYNFSVVGKSTLLCLGMVSFKNVPIVEVGSFYQKNKGLELMDYALYERQILYRNTSPDYLNVLIYLNNGNEKGIHSKKINEFKHSISDNYELIISVNEVLINGKTYYGIMEYGYNLNQSKWFSGVGCKQLKW